MFVFMFPEMHVVKLRASAFEGVDKKSRTIMELYRTSSKDYRK